MDKPKEPPDARIQGEDRLHRTNMQLVKHFREARFREAWLNQPVRPRPTVDWGSWVGDREAIMEICSGLTVRQVGKQMGWSDSDIDKLIEKYSVKE
jgi:hypothetical protein